MIIQSAGNHGKFPEMSPRQQPYRIFTVPRLCYAFGRTSLVWCINSCCNRVKPSQEIIIEHNWCVGADHWRKNDYSTQRYMEKLSSSMTMLSHKSQDRSKHTWKRWNGRSYPTDTERFRIIWKLLIAFHGLRVEIVCEDSCRESILSDTESCVLIK